MKFIKFYIFTRWQHYIKCHGETTEEKFSIKNEPHNYNLLIKILVEFT